MQAPAVCFTRRGPLVCWSVLGRISCGAKIQLVESICVPVVSVTLLVLAYWVGMGGGGGGGIWLTPVVPLSRLAFNWARELLTVSEELDELVLLLEDVESVVSLELSSEVMGGGGGGGICPMKLRAELVLSLLELELLESESSRSPKSAEEESPLLVLSESEPPRLVACWIWLKVAAADSVSPAAM